MCAHVLSDHPDAGSGFRACCLPGSVAKLLAPVQRCEFDAKLKNHPIAQKTVPARCSRATSGLMCCRTMKKSMLHIFVMEQLKQRDSRCAIARAERTRLFAEPGIPGF